MPEAGPDTPAAARVWDYWRGGRDYYPADAGLADEVERICPGAPRSVRAAREFASAAAARAAREGIGQFLVLGCGYPLDPAVHDAARAVNPAARAAYADDGQDAAYCTSWAYLDERRLAGIAVACADLRDPAAVLGGEGVREVIRPAEPACVILGLVLHFWAPGDAARICAGYMSRLAPGSWLAAAAGRNGDGGQRARVRAAWREAAGTELHSYTPAQFRALFAGLEAVAAPGPLPGPRGEVHVMGGIGRRPASC